MLSARSQQAKPGVNGGKGVLFSDLVTPWFRILVATGGRPVSSVLGGVPARPVSTLFRPFRSPRRMTVNRATTGSALLGNMLWT